MCIQFSDSYIHVPEIWDPEWLLSSNIFAQLKSEAILNKITVVCDIFRLEFRIDIHFSYTMMIRDII